LETGQRQAEGQGRTEDDLNVIDGRRDRLEGKLQERYGWSKDRIRKDFDDWLSAQR
jgi:uncharacterized protein YjbJ (UPF0337 family)